MEESSQAAAPDVFTLLSSYAQELTERRKWTEKEVRIQDHNGCVCLLPYKKEYSHAFHQEVQKCTNTAVCFMHKAEKWVVSWLLSSCSLQHEHGMCSYVRVCLFNEGEQQSCSFRCGHLIIFICSGVY